MAEFTKKREKYKRKACFSFYFQVPGNFALFKAELQNNCKKAKSYK